MKSQWCYIFFSSSADSPQNAEQQQTVKKHTRGQAFVNQSLSQTLTHKLGSGNVLSNARLWDVTIVRLEKLLEGLSRYIKPGKTTSLKTLPASNKSHSNKSLVVKVRKLQVPFIKVEDHSRQYKPLVHELKEWPKPWFDSPPALCPFDRPQHIEDKEEKDEKLKADRKQLRKDSTKIKYAVVTFTTTTSGPFFYFKRLIFDVFLCKQVNFTFKSTWHIGWSLILSSNKSFFCNSREKTLT